MGFDRAVVQAGKKRRVGISFRTFLNRCVAKETTKMAYENRIIA